MKKNFICLAILILLTACSTYQSNSSLSFDMLHPREKPSITIGKINVGSEKLTYLGWVEAEVKRPSPLVAAPSQDQVDLVLAELGKKLGADAVTFIKYKPSLLGNALTARGQAVKYKNLSANEMALLLPVPDPSLASTPKATPVNSNIYTSKPAKKETRTYAFSAKELAIMKSNATFLQQQAKLLNRQDLELVAEKLVRILENAQ